MRNIYRFSVPIRVEITSDSVNIDKALWHCDHGRTFSENAWKGVHAVTLHFFLYLYI